MSDSVVVERPVRRWPVGAMSALKPGNDVFDELVVNREVEELVAVRRLALIVRACDEYDIVVPDLYGDETAEDTLAEPRDGAEGWVRLGADGTPPVGEFLSVELAPLLGCSVVGMRARMAEALNLRHRHPRLWEQVTVWGTVPAWKALQVAGECVAAGLSWEACQQVDTELVEAIGLLGWARARRLLAGLIVRADPAAAAERVRRRRTRRGVWTSPVEDGQVLIEARVDAGDGLALEAQVARIATLLLRDPDPEAEAEPEPLPVRRAKALAMLAIPHLAAAFLEDHALVEDHTQPTATPTTAGAAVGEGRVLRVDPDRLRPRATLFVHVHADDLAPPDQHGEVPAGSGVARVEGHGPIDLASLHQLLHGCRVTVRPVIDLNGPPATDAYEVPDRLREHVINRNPVEVFPYGTRESRGCDMDHTRRYRRGAPAGALQTRADNLGPLSRTAHRTRTHGDWEIEQLRPGIFWWQSRAGYEYVVTPHGTLPLGRTRRGGSAQPGAAPDRPATHYEHGPHPAQIEPTPDGWDQPPPF